MNDGVRAARRVYEDRDRAYHELLKRRRGRGSKAKGTEPVVYTITRKRSDRSEAHARALAFFVGHCDLDSMHVGAYQKGGLIAFYDLERMAQGIGISPWQLDRVLSDFKAAKWIHRHQSRELVEDPAGVRPPRYKGRIGILKLTLAALEAVGLSEQWRDNILRRRAELAEEDRARRAAGVATVISPAVDVAVRDLLLDLAPKLAPDDEEVPEGSRDYYNQLLFRVHREHPDWTDDGIRQEARRRLNGPPPDRQR